MAHLCKSCPTAVRNLRARSCRSSAAWWASTSCGPPCISPLHQWRSWTLARTRTLNSMLGKVVSTSQRDWHLHVPYVVSAYRASVHSATGHTPNFLMLERETRSPIELIVGFPPDAEGAVTYSDAIATYRNRWRAAHEHAREHLECAAERMKHAYDLRVRARSFQTGDRVWYFSLCKFVGQSAK